MNLSELLAHYAALSAPRDDAGLDSLRARLFGGVRASGWVPAGSSRGASELTESDAALLASFVAGGADAFDILFDRHAPRLNGYARRWLQSADAADAVQEAFLVLFKNAAALLDREEVNVVGYLFVTLRHRLLGARSRREVLLAEVGEQELSSEDDGYRSMCRREEAGRLAALLERTCNPLEQHVVMLDVEDLSDAEIASALEISAGHVRIARWRAHKKLRGALEKGAAGGALHP